MFSNLSIKCPPFCLLYRREARGKSVGTNKILFRVLPFEAVPMPEHGAQIFARAPTKSSVQTSAGARESGTGT